KKPWDCGDGPKSVVSGNGECMPPRRQTLCINYLKELSDNKTEDDLKTALLKSVSLETHWLWDKYKKDNNNKNGRSLDDELKQDGKIPEDFKRQMFYTYSDFRDLVLGTDIYKTT
ncbi:putative EMP1-like protein, partial [Plasmodium gaboni]